MNWKVVGLAALVVAVGAFLLKGGMGEQVAKEEKPVTPASVTESAPAPVALTGDAAADIDAILASEENAESAAIADLDQDSTLVANDAAALSDMTNAYDATQF